MLRSSPATRYSSTDPAVLQRALQASVLLHLAYLLNQLSPHAAVQLSSHQVAPVSVSQSCSIVPRSHLTHTSLSSYPLTCCGPACPWHLPSTPGTKQTRCLSAAVPCLCSVDPSHLPLTCTVVLASAAAYYQTINQITPVSVTFR